MKNLLIYINPRRDFDPEHHTLARIQIDNSLDLGWRREEILIVTNFQYEHNGIKALVVPDKNYCDYHAQMSKMNTLITMFDMGLIDDDLWWFHDFDAIQNHPIPETELGLTPDEIGFTDYGYIPKWNTGSFFFRKNSRDVMELIKDRAYELQTDEERALGDLSEKNTANINSRYKRLHITYNFPGSKNGLKNLTILHDMVSQYGMPVRVLHFHPMRWRGFFLKAMYGRNALKIPLMTNRLQRIFRQHGYT